MSNYVLNIAGYKIRFENTSGKTDIVPSERFTGYVSDENEHDLLIRVHTGKIMIPEGAKKVFDAPYVEEVNNVRIKKSDEFWSVFQYHDHLIITARFPHKSGGKTAMLNFSLKETCWDLLTDTDDTRIDPLEYPLDGLILYYLTVLSGDIMIHGSGVNNKGKGYLFSGISGKGKTTMAKLWDKHGAKIIHDDRLIIRNTGKGFKMYNTPVYRNEEPRESPLDKIFLIGHGNENELIPLKDASAVSMVMANCIQHNWDTGIVKGLLEAVTKICEDIPVFKLSFKPDPSVIEYLLNNE